MVIAVERTLKIGCFTKNEIVSFFFASGNNHFPPVFKQWSLSVFLSILFFCISPSVALNNLSVSFCIHNLKLIECVYRGSITVMIDFELWYWELWIVMDGGCLCKCCFGTSVQPKTYQLSFLCTLVYSYMYFSFRYWAKIC